MAIGRKEETLQEKQSIRFGADIWHAYHNVSDKVCTAYNVILFSEPLKEEMKNV